MKFNPKAEYIVLTSVKELGLASEEETKEFIESNSFEVPANISLILERWKARDLLCVQYCEDNVKRYKMAKIPPSFMSCKMENIKTMKVKDMANIITEVEKSFSEPTTISPTNGGKGNSIGNYKEIKVKYSHLIHPRRNTGEGDNVFKLHRNFNNKPIVTQQCGKDGSEKTVDSSS
jgi:hypothetical protein